MILANKNPLVIRYIPQRTRDDTLAVSESSPTKNMCIFLSSGCNILTAAITPHAGLESLLIMLSLHCWHRITLAIWMKWNGREHGPTGPRFFSECICRSIMIPSLWLAVREAFVSVNDLCTLCCTAQTDERPKQKYSLSREFCAAFVCIHRK